MRRVAVMGVAGGVGCSTVTAHLAQAFRQIQRLGLALDLSPDNQLRLFFAMDWQDRAGWATQLIENEQAWHQAAYVSESGVRFVPFGELDQAQIIQLSAERLHPLQQLSLPDDLVCLYDCPRWFYCTTQYILPQVEHLLVVVRADANCYAALVKIWPQLRKLSCKIHLLINQFQANRLIDQDLCLLFEQSFAEHLIPIKIHQDEFVREAFAAKQTAFEFNPNSVAAHDFTALGTWFLSKAFRHPPNG